jgi:hypothetical protein
LDPVTLTIVQPIYIGRPIFAAGLADPIPIRSGVLEGIEDVVEVPDDLPPPRPRTTQAYIPAPGESGKGEGLGLLDCPELDEVLAGISGKAGSVREALRKAAFTYIREVGHDQVDVVALTTRLTEEALKHRSEAEVTAYKLAGLVRWCLSQAAAPHPALDFPQPAGRAGEGAGAPRAARLRPRPPRP